jgi:Cu2+-containing amine oxidase
MLRFVYITLREPPKAAVLASGDGGPAPDREARVILRDRATRRTIEAEVSHEGSRNSLGQPVAYRLVSGNTTSICAP